MEDLKHTSHEKAILIFIKKDEISGLISYMANIPLNTTMECSPGYINFTICKTTLNSFKVSCTVSRFLSTNMGFKELALFLFGKLDSSFFTWD